MAIKLKQFAGETKGHTGKFVCLLAEAAVKKTRSGQDYVQFQFKDNDLAIDGRMWNAGSESIAHLAEAELVEVEGKLDSYNGVNQVIVHKIEDVTDKYSVLDFVKTAPEDLTSLIEEYETYINKIEDKLLKKIVWDMYTKYFERLKTWPAARGHHHNYVGGLLFHTVSMLRIASHVEKQYPSVLDMDIVYAAIAVHDLGKVHEYGDPINPSYTEKGKQLGHISIVAAELYALYSNHYTQEDSKFVSFLHAVLAHHGKLEWGSPVAPQTREAEIVHQIDMLDSRMAQNKFN